MEKFINTLLKSIVLIDQETFFKSFLAKPIAVSIDLNSAIPAGFENINKYWLQFLDALKKNWSLKNKECNMVVVVRCWMGRGFMLMIVVKVNRIGDVDRKCYEGAGMYFDDCCLTRWWWEHVVGYIEVGEGGGGMYMRFSFPLWAVLCLLTTKCWIYE